MKSRFSVSIVLFAYALLLVTPAAAQAGFVKVGAFGSEGEGGGQFGAFAPFGMAVDQATGDVYVSDIVHHRVEKFDPVGAYILQFGSEGEGNGQFRYAMGVGGRCGERPHRMPTIWQKGKKKERFFGDMLATGTTIAVNVAGAARDL